MKFIAFTLSIVFNLCLWHQTASGKGTISGKVVDKVSNETLIGVLVLVDGGAIGTTTDIDGKYNLDIDAGNYNISIKFVGYQTKLVENVLVNDNETHQIDFVLEPAIKELSEVAVVSEMNRERAGSVLLMQKRSAVVQDGISSEAIKKTPDKNTGEVLKRVSGASVQENKFVIVRGLSDRYNLAMVNNTMLPSSEADRKAFSFDLFPASLLDNLFILKTASPDLPGEFAGGIIRLNTKDVPDRKFISITVGTGMTSGSTFENYSSGIKGRKDWLGFDDGTRALPDIFPSSADYKKQTQAQKFELTKLVKNDWSTEDKESSPLNRSAQLSFGSRFQLFKKKTGLIGAFTYSRSNKHTSVERSDYDFDGTKRYDFNDDQYFDNVLAGAIINLSMYLNDNSKISLKNYLSINSEDLTVVRTGDDIELKQEKRATALQYTSSMLINSQLEGEHSFGKSRMSLKWFTGVGYVKRDIPDLRRLQYYRNFEISEASDTIFRAYVPFGSASPNYAGKFYSSLNEKIYSAGADFGIPFKLKEIKSLFKTGFSEQYKEREFDARVLGYVIPNAAFFNYSLLESSPDTIFNESHIGTKGFRLDDITNPSDHYTAQSNLHSVYLMLDNTVDKWRFVWGARGENFIQKLNSLGYSNDTVEVNRSYFNVLPSINITYSLTEKTNLRAAAFRSVSRPEFRELAPFSFYDFNTSTSIQGNDSLLLSNINNFDLRFETYPSNGEIFSFSVFYKVFESPIEQIVESSGAGSRSVAYVNAKGATNVGVEAEFRKKLDAIQSVIPWKFWRRLTAFGNVAFISSKVDKSDDLRANEDRPMQGQSPYIINCGFLFSNEELGYSINLSYNRIGRRIFQVGNQSYKSIYEAPRDLLDLQLSKTIFKNGEFKISMNDILANKSVFYQDRDESGKYDVDDDSCINSIRYGSGVSFSLSYKL